MPRVEAALSGLRKSGGTYDFVNIGAGA